MKTLKSLMAVIAISGLIPANGQTNDRYHLSEIEINNNDGKFNLDMTINPADYKLKYNQQLEVTPVLISADGNDSIVMPTVAIAGKNAYYYTLRSGKLEGQLFRSGKDASFQYTQSLPWRDWMETSRLEIRGVSTGCCGVELGDDETPVAEMDWRVPTFSPVFHFEMPMAETHKQRRLEGKAYINFPVNRTEIYPDYMVNPQELRKILNSIDVVRFDPDATVKSITLVGFASPEGPYKNNVRLARGRTEALRVYVSERYDFPDTVFHTDFVPEDWTGLRDSVAAGVLPERTEILDFIDNANVPIERRNDELRKRFPSAYKYLLKNVYPSLRHTNYIIDYEIKTFTDVNEIRKVLAERPQNLSLNEFFLAANSYPVDSDEYNNAYDMAVLFFPDNEVANLNAANCAIRKGDFVRARKLLAKVGESPTKVYALAIMDAEEGNLVTAQAGMKQAADMGIDEAAEAAEQLERIINRPAPVKFVAE